MKLIDRKWRATTEGYLCNNYQVADGRLAGHWLRQSEVAGHHRGVSVYLGSVRSSFGPLTVALLEAAITTGGYLCTSEVFVGPMTEPSTAQPARSDWRSQ
jgi:hypothetical protein